MSPIGINLEPLPPFSPCVDIDGYERLPASNGQTALGGTRGGPGVGEPEDRAPRPPLEAPARPQARSPSAERQPAAVRAAVAAPGAAPSADDIPDTVRYVEAGPWSQAPVPRAVTTAPVSSDAASGTLVLPGEERAANVPLAPAETSLALSLPSSAEPERRIVCVALHFSGRKKMVRHLESTYVGQLAELHLGHQASDKRRPVVVTDSEGFEVGKELTLGVIARTVGERDDILELTMKVDEW